MISGAICLFIVLVVPALGLLIRYWEWKKMTPEEKENLEKGLESRE